MDADSLAAMVERAHSRPAERAQAAARFLDDIWVLAQIDRGAWSDLARSQPDLLVLADAACDEVESWMAGTLADEAEGWLRW